MGAWINWHGGPPPFPKGTKHFVKYRDGAAVPQSGQGWGDRAWEFYWEHSLNSPDDIIAYRKVEE